jgi:hypothetical protein
VETGRLVSGRNASPPARWCPHPVAPGVLGAHLGSRETRILGSSVSNMRAPGFAAATSRSAKAASNHMSDTHKGGTEPLQDIDEQL